MRPPGYGTVPAVRTSELKQVWAASRKVTPESGSTFRETAHTGWLLLKRQAYSTVSANVPRYSWMTFGSFISSLPVPV